MVALEVLPAVIAAAVAAWACALALPWVLAPDLNLSVFTGSSGTVKLAADVASFAVPLAGGRAHRRGAWHRDQVGTPPRRDVPSNRRMNGITNDTAENIEVQALQGLDLVIETGELTALVGASGSGKSTLVNILAGGTPPPPEPSEWPGTTSRPCRRGRGSPTGGPSSGSSGSRQRAICCPT